jgi:hypothetical protein
MVNAHMYVLHVTEEHLRLLLRLLVHGVEVSTAYKKRRRWFVAGENLVMVSIAAMKLGTAVRLNAHKLS